MMKPEYCPDYVGVACVDGTCPVANCEEYATPTITGAVPYNTHDLVIDLGNSVPHPDRFNCPYVNRIGQLTVSVLLNRFARKEHRT